MFGFMDCLFQDGRIEMLVWWHARNEVLGGDGLGEMLS